ncbi:hypothetical protein H2198_001122 [Neophaeococcomyces mojaviensis]|uniref:Uncharacterized protein n=1 Tax=Neophaeococcomyces mojaviensis TaxID=3383035 RepID=A0ACC3AHX9_9EURO|nr:hypothetical protein H2198_001122 [Knufia sp. JES_112]
MDRKSKRQKLSPTEDVSPSTAQASASTTNQRSSDLQPRSPTAASPPNTPLSWYNRTWPRKAAPITQVARESISFASNTAIETASSIKDKVRATPTRKASLALTLGKTTSNKSLPVDATTTKDHAMPEARKPSKTSPAQPRESEDLKLPPESEANPTSEDVQKDSGADQKPAEQVQDEQKPQSEPEAPKHTNTTQETTAPRSWIGWLARGDGIETKALASVAQPPEQSEASYDTEQTEQHRTNALPEPAPENIPLPPEDTEQPAKQPLNAQRRSWLPIWSNAVASQSAPVISSPPADKPTEQQIQINVELDKSKGDQSAAQEISENMPAANEIPTKEPQDGVKSSAWVFWSRNKPVETKSLNEASHEGEIAVAHTESENRPRRASLEWKNDTKPDSVASQPPEAAASSSIDNKKLQGDNKKSKRNSKEVAVPQPANPQPMPKATKIESKGAAATAIAPAELQASRPASPAPPKKNYEHLLMPAFEETLKLPENPTWMEQLARLFYGTKEPDFKHLNLVKEPPRVKNALAIGVHGYFPAPLIRSVLGQPTGTSVKFADMAAKSIKQWIKKRGYECHVKTAALEGEGKIADRIDLLWKLLLNWIEEIRKSDFVMVACHSQGVPVAIMLVAKLIHFGCITPSTRVGICAMAGVNMGPFPEFKSRWISGSAGELFEFSDVNSKVSTDYLAALEDVLKFGVRITYVGSIDDQLVSLESSIFAPISHPHIYRAVSIDSRIHAPSFLSHLVAFALKLRNLGVQDHGLIRELSGPLAGSLYSGDGHSRLYEDAAIYDLATSFALETTSMPGVPVTQRATSSSTGNPFILPFAMRGMLEEDFVKSDLQEEAEQLLREFDEWKPTTKALKDVKWRLEGIRSRI